MRTIPEHNGQVTEKPAYRIDVGIHDPLMGGAAATPLKPCGVPITLPDPSFPRYPALRGDVEPDARFLPNEGNPYRTRVTPFMVRRALCGWLYPLHPLAGRAGRMPSAHRLPVY